MKKNYLFCCLIAMLLAAVIFTAPVCGEAFNASSIGNSLQPEITAPGPVLADSIPLSKNQVRRYIKTRIATARLQNKMRANAGQYDNVIRAFYKKRTELLNKHGWTETEFESVKKRIIAAITAMEIEEDLESSKEKHKRKIAEIRSNEYFTKEQKDEMIEGMNKFRADLRAQYINPTKPDWPAVKPYRETMQLLTDWIGGNISEPPQVK